MSKVLQFRIGWGSWISTAVVAEISHAPRSTWVQLLVMFIVMEAIALLNKTRGDTLSETVWAWVQEKKARAWSAGIWALWLVWHFYLVVSRMPEPAYVGPAILSLVLLAWLPAHLATRGAAG